MEGVRDAEVSGAPARDLDAEVRLAVLRGFVDDGNAPPPDELAARLGVVQIDVERSLHRLHDAHVLVLAPGTPYVWMANPFSALPTPFVVTSAGDRWWGNCVWDALGILAAVDRDGEVRTRCPDCGEPLVLEIRDGELAAGAGTVVHYAVPAASWWADIGFN